MDYPELKVFFKKIVFGLYLWNILQAADLENVPKKLNTENFLKTCVFVLILL